MNTWINEKLLPPMMKFVNTRPMLAIKNGMIYPIPFIIIGAIFLILGNFPIQSVADYLSDIGLSAIFMKAYNGSMAMMALMAVFGIAYSWVENEGVAGAPSAGLLGIVVHIILQPGTVTEVVNVADATKTSTDWMVSGVISQQWFGGKGMIVSMIVGLIVGWLYSYFVKKGITIKLPEQVPSNVAASFTALVPGAVLISGATAVYAFFDMGLNTTFVQWIYDVIQTPLQHATDGPFGVFVVAFIPVFLWFFGVHGATIVQGIMKPLLLANSADNNELYMAGQLSLENGAHIVTMSFMDQFVTVTGSGMTIGLVVYMLTRAKSVQMKSIGKVGIGPALFNINEPVLFGTPIVLNPLLAVPFILTPVLSGTLTYIMIATGALPPFNGVYVPWTTPPIFSGLIVGGWKMMLWQALMISMSVAIYYVYARKYDLVLLEQERQNAQQG
jgi:PTS system cellobiose-specific IIC component